MYTDWPDCLLGKISYDITLKALDGAYKYILREEIVYQDRRNNLLLKVLVNDAIYKLLNVG